MAYILLTAGLNRLYTHFVCLERAETENLEMEV